MKAVLPNSWKEIVTSDNRAINCITLQDCKIKIKNIEIKWEEIETRYVYWVSIKTKSQRPTSEANLANRWDSWTRGKWLGIDIYTTPFKLSSNTKMHMIQFKSLHRILAINHNIHNMQPTVIATLFRS